MKKNKVKDHRYCPIYIPRNELNEPLFYIEFIEPYYTLVNDSFFNEQTLFLIHTALDYSQSTVINSTPFDFEQFVELLRQDIFKYLNFVPIHERDDIPRAYYKDGRLSFDRHRQDLFELREFFFNGKLKDNRHGKKLEGVLNIYLQHLGFQKFFRFLKNQPQVISPERFIFDLSNQLTHEQKQEILKKGSCFCLHIQRSSMYLVNSEIISKCWIIDNIRK